MSRSKLPPLTQTVTENTEEPSLKGSTAKTRRKKKPEFDEHSVAESTGSRSLPGRSMSHTSVIENGDIDSDPQDSPRRPKRKRRSPANTQDSLNGGLAEVAPRQTTKKKRVKRTRPVAPSSDNLGLATELYDLQEDIVNEEAVSTTGLDQQDFITTSAVARSKRPDKVFTETKGGFKATNKFKLDQKRAQAAEAVANVPEDSSQRNTIQFALSTHHCFKTIAIFLQGMFAGMTLWQIIASYMLINAGSTVFAEYYRVLGIPVQCTWFFFFAVASVYALDRYDLASPTRELLIKSMSLQAGTICVVFYMVGLIVSLVTAPLDELIGLNQTSTYNNGTDSSSGCDWLCQWQGLNVSRGVLAMLGWFVVSLRLRTDRLSKSLLKSNDDILQPETVARNFDRAAGKGTLWSTSNA